MEGGDERDGHGVRLEASLFMVSGRSITTHAKCIELWLWMASGFAFCGWVMITSLNSYDFSLGP